MGHIRTHLSNIRKKNSSSKTPNVTRQLSQEQDWTKALIQTAKQNQKDSKDCSAICLTEVSQGKSRSASVCFVMKHRMRTERRTINIWNTSLSHTDCPDVPEFTLGVRGDLLWSVLKSFWHSSSVNMEVSDPTSFILSLTYSHWDSAHVCVIIIINKASHLHGFA